MTDPENQELAGDKASSERKIQLIESAFQLANQTPSVDETNSVDSLKTGRVVDAKRNEPSHCRSCNQAIDADRTLGSQNEEWLPTTDGLCQSCSTKPSLEVSRTGDTVPKQVGSFQLQRRLGQGAFGQVWLAYDKKLDRQVAIKFPRDGEISTTYRELFLREARNAAQLRHPNIVNIHEVGNENGLIYIVCEYIESIPLDRWIKKHRPSNREIAVLCIKVARALQTAHDYRVIHRDLKPSNILMDSNGQPYITDFGLSKRNPVESMSKESNSRNENARASLNQTGDESAGQILSTPAYMSPEQAEGHGEKADGRTDIYSLGVILFELLTGEKPFRGEYDMLLRKVIQELPPAPRSLTAEIPADLDTICLKCLGKKPVTRYQTANDLADDLQRWTDQRPIHARPVGDMERLGRWCQRNQLAAGLIAAVFLSLLAGIVGVGWQTRKKSAALNLAKEQTVRGDHLLADTQEIVDELLYISTSDALLRRNPGTVKLRKQLLLRAQEYYRRFIETEGSGRSKISMVSALAGSANVNNQLANFDQAIKDAESGIELANLLINNGEPETQLRKDIIHCLNTLGESSLRSHDLDSAQNALLQSVNWCQKINKGRSLDVVGWQASAFDMLGSIATLQNKPTQSVKYYQAAESAFQEIVESFNKSEFTLANLANVQLNLSRLQPQRRLTLCDKALRNLAQAGTGSTKFEDLRDDMINRSPHWNNQTARALISKAHHYQLLRELDKAHQLQVQAREFVDCARNRDPANFELRMSQLFLLIDVGLNAKIRMNKTEALAAFDQARQELDRLQVEFPDNINVALKSVMLNEMYSETLFQFGQTERAIELAGTAIKTRNQIIEWIPGIPGHVFELSKTHIALGQYYLQTREIEEATVNFDRSLELMHSAIDNGMSRSETNRLMSSYYHAMQMIHEEKGQTEKAFEFGKKNIELGRLICESAPNNARARADYINSIASMGHTHMAANDFDQAIDRFEQALAETKEHLLKTPDYQLNLGANQVNLAICLRKSDRHSESQEQSGLAIENLQAMLGRHPEHRTTIQFLGNAKACHARTLWEQVVRRVEDNPEKTEWPAIVDDARLTCEIMEWKHKKYRETFVGVVSDAIKHGMEISEILNAVPEKMRNELKDQIESVKSFDL